MKNKQRKDWNKNNIMFDYTELKNRIRFRFGTQKAYAEFLGISPNSLTRKLENKNYFTQEEIMKSLHRLSINSYFETISVFFKDKVE